MNQFYLFFSKKVNFIFVPRIRQVWSEAEDLTMNWQSR